MGLANDMVKRGFVTNAIRTHKRSAKEKKKKLPPTLNHLHILIPCKLPPQCKHCSIIIYGYIMSKSFITSCTSSSGALWLSVIFKLVAPPPVLCRQLCVMSLSSYLLTLRIGLSFCLVLSSWMLSWCLALKVVY